MTYITPFNLINKNDILSAGGKGANLGELAAAGFPVPPGFVISTSAYDAFIQANELQPQVLSLAASVSTADPDSGADTAEEIRALFMQGDIPADLAAEITSALDAFASDGGAVAVRSSATAEDLPDASFAGQQETFLNVRGQGALLEAVKGCWASLWTARAMAYRQRQGIDSEKISLAVVVQQLFPAESAGILFTANPVNGVRNQALINAAWGLGEAIVSGKVNPDSIVMDKDSGTILSRETAEKMVMTVRNETGTVEKPVPADTRSQPVLEDGAAAELMEIGVKIEAHYGMPMDVEWAIAGDEIAILQARPITSLPEPQPELPDFTWEPIAPKSLWMRRQLVEHMPEPLSPLFEDLYLGSGMDQTVQELMDAMGAIANTRLDLSVMMPHGWARTINGYAYTAASIKMDWKNFVAVLKMYTRIFRMLKVPDFNWDGFVLPKYKDLIAHWDELDRSSAADQDLLRGMAQLAQADSHYWFGSAVNMGLSRFMDTAFDRFLRWFMIRYALPKPRPGSASFLRGFDSFALDAQAEMEDLAGSLRASSELSKLVHETPAGEMIEALDAHPEGEPILEGIRHYLDVYGHQIYNLDFVDPTQIEDPMPLLLSLKSLVESPPDQDVRTRQAAMADDRDALVAQTLAALNPVSRWMFRKMWAWTMKWAPYRESIMFYMGAAWPTVRRLGAELGQRLADVGAITKPDDIYYLYSQEIVAAVEEKDGGQSVPSYDSLVRERRELRTARNRVTPPPKVPQRGEMRFGPIKISMFDPTPSDAASEGPLLNGYAVSTGRVTAPASVIRTIEDFSEMKPGTVLVCTTTTPAWTPLFSQAVGLVTDVGGALAHGSIVAREFGIPAVMGTGVATERIRSGMMLTVDGEAGTVVLEGEE